jgi:hypothetical protein
MYFICFVWYICPVGSLLPQFLSSLSFIAENKAPPPRSACTYTLKMEVPGSSETFENIYKTSRHHFPEDNGLQSGYLRVLRPKSRNLYGVKWNVRQQRKTQRPQWQKYRYSQGDTKLLDMEVTQTTICITQCSHIQLPITKTHCTKTSLQRIDPFLDKKNAQFMHCYHFLFYIYEYSWRPNSNV